MIFVVMMVLLMVATAIAAAILALVGASSHSEIVSTAAIWCFSTLCAEAGFLYIFWPQRHVLLGAKKSHLEYLRERKEVIYENLRDLNFEYKAGKFPESDYVEMRAGLEDEAAAVLAEIQVLEALEPEAARR